MSLQSTNFWREILTGLFSKVLLSKRTKYKKMEVCFIMYVNSNCLCVASMCWASPGFWSCHLIKYIMTLAAVWFLFYELIILHDNLKYGEFGVLVVRNMTFENGNLTWHFDNCEWQFRTQQSAGRRQRNMGGWRTLHFKQNKFMDSRERLSTIYNTPSQWLCERLWVKN